MNVNGIGKQNYYEKTNGVKGNQKGNGSGFYESLSENLNERAGTEQKAENAASPKNAAGAVANTGYSYRNVPAKAAEVYESEKAAVSAVSECEVRGIIYRESDYRKVYAIEGFRLMAQVDVDKRSVYVERKAEDGTFIGYEVDIDKLDGSTTDPVEQAALEAWKKKMSEAGGNEDGEEELTLEEALLEFYALIEDRIKNGPPKYLIGNSEFSIKEWDKLIEGIDGQIDAIKEELRARIEKMKEQQMKADAVNDLQSAQDDLRDAENEEIEEKLLMSLFRDMSKKI